MVKKMRTFWHTLLFVLKLAGMVFLGWLLFIWGGFKMIKFFINLSKGFSITMRCPAGHRNSTIGKWTCKSLGKKL